MEDYVLMVDTKKYYMQLKTNELNHKVHVIEPK